MRRDVNASDRKRASDDDDDKNIRASDEFTLVRLDDIMVEFLRLSHRAMGDATRSKLDVETDETVRWRCARVGY